MVDRAVSARLALVLIVIVGIGIIASVFIGLDVIGPGKSKTSTTPTSPSGTMTTSTQPSSGDPYAHTAPATFALVSEPSVPEHNSLFVKRAEETYVFVYANQENFTKVELSNFVLVAFNSTSPSGYYSLISSKLSSQAVSEAFAHGGATILLGPVWSANQTVFALAGYSGSTLTAALDLFFVHPKPLLPAPKTALLGLGNTTSASAAAAMREAPSGYTPFRRGFDQGCVNVNATNLCPQLGPELSAYYGNYNLTPSDKILYPDYSYYFDFANLISYMPILADQNNAWQANGTGLPHSSGVCVPAPPPPDGESICYGELIGMPVFQFGSNPVHAPLYYLKNADCSLGPIRCTNEMGLLLSGCQTQMFCSSILNLFNLPDMLNITNDWNLTNDATVINLTSAFAAYNYAQVNVSSVTMLLPLPILPPLAFSYASSLSQMIADGIDMYSAPTGICEVTGNVCISGCTLFSSACVFNYTMWALLSVSSNIPGVTSELNPDTNFTGLFYPVTLNAPSTFTNFTGTYSFSYWDVTSEINGTSYTQLYDSPNASIDVLGPVQAKAVYTFSAASGSIVGRVEFAYLNFHTGGIEIGPPIEGATVTVKTQSGSVVATSVTGLDGFYATPYLSPGCYNVSAYEYGFYLQPAVNPQCVDGTVNDSIFQWENYFNYYALSSNELDSIVLPAHENSGVVFYLWYPNGLPAANITVSAFTDSGSVQGNLGPPFGGLASSRTDAGGAAYFTWTAGGTPGFYRIFFNTVVAGQTLFYAFPTWVLGFNTTVQNSTVTVYQGSSVAVPLSTGYFVNSTVNATHELFFIGINATLSVSGIPTGVSAYFTPNPLVAPAYVNLGYNPLRPDSALELQIGNNTPPGVYRLSLSSVFSSVSFESSVTNTTPLTLKVLACVSPLGELTGDVLNLDGNPTPANVTIFSSSGVKVFTQNTTTGFFSTGYSLTPGKYNVSAYLPYLSNPYFSETVAVKSCSSQSLMLTPRGALSVQVLYDGAPASHANLSITYPNGYVLNVSTNAQGVYSSAYSLQPGNYTVVAHVNGQSAGQSFLIQGGKMTSVTLDVGGSLPLRDAHQSATGVVPRIPFVATLISLFVASIRRPRAPRIGSRIERRKIL